MPLFPLPALVSMTINAALLILFLVSDWKTGIWSALLLAMALPLYAVAKTGCGRHSRAARGARFPQAGLPVKWRINPMETPPCWSYVPIANAATATCRRTASEARICTYECTFCAACVETNLGGVCPNCGGNFAARPIRPGAKLIKDPPSAKGFQAGRLRQNQTAPR